MIGHVVRLARRDSSVAAKSVFALFAAAVIVSAAQGAENKWTPLFNGRDLSGWSVKCKPADRAKGYWNVRDGEICVDSVGDRNHDYYWLLSDGEYANFELKLKFKIYRDVPGNSGIQIRSRYDEAEGWLDGPQLDIHPPTPYRVGLIYDETRDVKRWISPSLEKGNHKILPEMANPEIKLLYGDEGWNEMVIIAKGTHIKVIVNGEVASDYDGRGVLDDAVHKKYNVGLKGHIAIQLHRKHELKARFKDILIREL